MRAFSTEVRVVVEGAGDQGVESGIIRFSRGGDQIRTGDGSELRAYENGSTFLLAARLQRTFCVAPFRAYEVARPGDDGRERDLVVLMSLLDARGPEVFQDDLDKVLRVPRLRMPVDQFIVFVEIERAVGREAFDGEKSGDPDFLIVLVSS